MECEDLRTETGGMNAEAKTSRSRSPKRIVLWGFAFLGWVFCASIMGGLPPLLGMPTALKIHLVAGPLGFALLAALYQRRRGDYPPLFVAAVFLGFVVGMDFLLVAVLILRSLEMFRSAIGTWIPFVLIFLASWGAGTWARKGTVR